MIRRLTLYLAAILALTTPANAQQLDGGCVTIGTTLVCPGGAATTIAGLTLSGGTLSGTTTLPGSGVIADTGQLGIGGAPGGGTSVHVLGNSLNTASIFGYRNAQTIQSGVTTLYAGYASAMGTAASSFTLANLRHFQVGQGTIGAGSTVTDQVGFYVGTSLTGATNNYGFSSNIANAAGRFNFYAGGTAPNFFAGRVLAGGAAPTLGSCGTSPSVSGDSKAGEVTMGTGDPTGCVITFAIAYTSAPYCTVSWQATPLASQSYTVSSTAITLTQTGTSSNKVNYTCWGQSGG